ncbi:MAG: ribosome-associated translation inhibitor RaiA [Opitutaceae bacterium]|nr:ribosome-associated translation inhibitor RaiA [Opitutaceae bacterium]
MTKTSHNESPSSAERTVIRGIHVDLTEAMKTAVLEKTARLFRHQSRIVRLRIDIELDKTRAEDQRFVAKGHIEIGGPDLVASVSSNGAYEAIDRLVDTLDGQLRRRASEYKERRHSDTLADHSEGL